MDEQLSKAAVMDTIDQWCESRVRGSVLGNFESDFRQAVSSLKANIEELSLNSGRKPAKIQEK